MKPEELAQWVIDNRYPKSENEKISDFEMFHFIVKESSQLEPLVMQKIAEVIENDEKDGIILSAKNLRYECYFNKDYYQIFIGQPQSGSMIEFKPPLVDGDSYSLRIYNKW